MLRQKAIRLIDYRETPCLANAHGPDPFVHLFR